MSLSQRIVRNVQSILLGKPEAVRLAVACLLAEGHLLIEDIPGVGKTTLALALARTIGGSFQRIQFTSDLMPSDLLGVSVYEATSQSFQFKPGPVFHNVVLADEINRASPKTQSALLEAMQERQVSIDNHTHPLPRPFFVIATQNPYEHHGTFPLPESQLDRFMMRLSLGYPSAETEAAILRGDTTVPKVSGLTAVGSAEEVAAEVERIRKVAVDASLDRYMVELARASRESPLIDMGLSPRGTLALRRAAQAVAAGEDRDYVIPDDVKAVSVPVLAHRLRPKTATFNGHTAQAADDVVRELVGQVSIPT
jgi:MoxR-like ATPase